MLSFGYKKGIFNIGVLLILIIGLMVSTAIIIQAKPLYNFELPRNFSYNPIDFLNRDPLPTGVTCEVLKPEVTKVTGLESIGITEAYVVDPGRDVFTVKVSGLPELPPRRKGEKPLSYTVYAGLWNLNRADHNGQSLQQHIDFTGSSFTMSYNVQGKLTKGYVPDEIVFEIQNHPKNARTQPIFYLYVHQFQKGGPTGEIAKCGWLVVNKPDPYFDGYAPENERGEGSGDEDED